MFRSWADTRSVDKICDELFESSREVFAEEEYEKGELVLEKPGSRHPVHCGHGRGDQEK